MLVGGQGTGRGSLVTNEQYKDFDLDFEFMLAEPGTKCSAELIGEKQENASEDKSCLYNSGVTFRTGYQVNIGRREAGEFIGIVCTGPRPARFAATCCGSTAATRSSRASARRRLESPADHREGTADHRPAQWQADCDVKDDPTDPAEARWKEAGPISLQWPPAGESAGRRGSSSTGT